VRCRRKAAEKLVYTSGVELGKRGSKPLLFEKPGRCVRALFVRSLVITAKPFVSNSQVSWRSRGYLLMKCGRN
jgi:hypothetical protein